MKLNKFTPAVASWIKTFVCVPLRFAVTVPAMLTLLPTAKGARTCLYVPETGKLYLAVPRQEGKDGPEIRIYQAKP